MVETSSFFGGCCYCCCLCCCCCFFFLSSVVVGVEFFLPVSGAAFVAGVVERRFHGGGDGGSGGEAALLRCSGSCWLFGGSSVDDQSEFLSLLQGSFRRSFASPRAPSLLPLKSSSRFPRLARISKLRRLTLTPRLKYAFRVGASSRGCARFGGSGRMGERRPRVSLSDSISREASAIKVWRGVFRRRTLALFKSETLLPTAFNRSVVVGARYSGLEAFGNGTREGL